MAQQNDKIKVLDAEIKRVQQRETDVREQVKRQSEHEIHGLKQENKDLANDLKARNAEVESTMKENSLLR